MSNEMPVVFTLIIRGVVAFVLIAGGIFCVYSAFRLMRQERAPNDDPAKFSGRLGPFEFSIASGTLGALVLCISAVWAGFGYMAAPTLHLARGDDGVPTIDIASTAPLSIEASVPFAEGASMPSRKDVVNVVAAAGSRQVSAATIIVPKSSDAGLAEARTDSIRQELKMAGVDESKIHTTQSGQSAIGDAAHLKVRIDFTNRSVLQALGTDRPPPTG